MTSPSPTGPRPDRWLAAMEKAAAEAESDAGRKFILDLIEGAKARRAAAAAEEPARREEARRAREREAWYRFDLELGVMHRAGDALARAAKGAEPEAAARAMVRFLETQAGARRSGRELEVVLGRMLTAEEWCRGSPATVPDDPAPPAAAAPGPVPPEG